MMTEEQDAQIQDLAKTLIRSCEGKQGGVCLVALIRVMGTVLNAGPIEGRADLIHTVLMGLLQEFDGVEGGVIQLTMPDDDEEESVH